MESFLPPASKNSGMGVLSVVEEDCVRLSVVSNHHFLISSEKAHTHLKYCNYAACTDPSALGA